MTVTRRHAMRLAGGAALGALAGPALAQSGDGSLARLQAAKKVRVGIANQPPYSALNPDGTVTGAAPEITKLIMGRLGITEIEALIGNYGDLIPGMLAGRWDFVSACLTITAARCSQVVFADPIVFDGAAIVYPKGSAEKAPTRLADLGQGDVTVGVQAGGADFRTALAVGVPMANIRQFTDDPAIMDGIVAKRVQFAVMSVAPMRNLIRQRNLEMDIVFPLPDDPSRGSSCAFRQGDADLYAAYQKELRAMKASGEYLRVIREFGFDTPPELINVTAEQACKP